MNKFSANTSKFKTMNELKGRSDSEMAKALKLEYDALKRHGKRTDLV